MHKELNRRTVILSVAAAIAVPGGAAMAQNVEIWQAQQAHDALVADRIKMIDVRSREEWAETGLAELAWPISLHEDRFSKRLFAAREFANGRPVALICATGGRSGSVMRRLRQSGYDGFIDVSEGMLGSRRGPGWINSGLPVVSMETGLSALPKALA
jgi:rhodanese-related sulfurtransferase